MNKILKTAGRPCSCPEGRVCGACTPSKKKKKFRLKPRIHVTTSRNPHIPITVTRFREKNPALVKIKDSLSSLKIRKSSKNEFDQSFRSSISSWYGRRKAIREQKSLDKKERKLLEKEKKEFEKAKKQFENEQKENAKLEREREEKEREKELLKYYQEQEEQRRLQEIEREKARQEREKEVLQQLEAEEELRKSYYTPQLRAETSPYYNVDDEKKTKVKGKKKKTKKKKLKPQKLASNKTVFVKKFNRRETWKDRFARWFYRFCCQLYCYMTCVFAVVFVIIFII